MKLWKDMTILERAFAIRDLSMRGLYATEIAEALGAPSTTVVSLAASNGIALVYKPEPAHAHGGSNGGDGFEGTAHQQRMNNWRRSRLAAKRARLAAAAELGQVPNEPRKPAPVTAIAEPPAPAVANRSRDMIILACDGPKETALEQVLVETPGLSRFRIIIDECAKRYGVGIADIMGDRRNVLAVAARHEAMYRLRHETTMSLPQIGKKLGRDHTSVLHGVRSHEARIMRVAA
jgi:Bacterial dnaA protein helix-turn-helix